MAESIKFTNKYVDTTGIYDSVLQITQAELNSKAVTVDLTSASIGTPNPVNADTLGGDPASDFFKSAKVVNNFTTTASGYALDARAGKSLNDSLSNKVQWYSINNYYGFGDSNNALMVNYNNKRLVIKVNGSDHYFTLTPFNP